MSGARGLPWALALSVIGAGCGAAGGAVATSKSSGATATASPVGSPVAEPDVEFTCSPETGGNSATQAQLTAVSTAHFDTYDQVTFEFAKPVTGGPLTTLPAFTMTPQPNTDFVKDGSGMPLKLEGSAALKLVVRGASGWDNLAPAPHQTYNGSLDQRVGLSVVQEIAEVGDYERVLSWGIGMSARACFHVIEMTAPARLVVAVATS